LIRYNKHAGVEHGSYNVVETVEIFIKYRKHPEAREKCRCLDGWRYKKYIIYIKREGAPSSP
jgi:hypothetical protein